jgi:hypothetical protein
MTRLAAFAVAALVLAAVGAPAQEQAGPDLSGRWHVSQARSSPGALGNSAKVSFASELIVQERSGDLHVEMRIPRTDPVTAVYKLDGSEVTVATPAGIVEKAKAVRDGQMLVITARRTVSSAFGDFVTDTKESWTRTGDVLTIRKTSTSEGISATETVVYEKAQP